MKTIRKKIIDLLDEFPVQMEWHDNADLANFLLSHGVTVQEWISVKDRLPETTRLCIASKYNVPFLAWWTGKDWREANTVTVVNGINYWMELPQPPKGE